MKLRTSTRSTRWRSPHPASSPAAASGRRNRRAGTRHLLVIERDGRAELELALVAQVAAVAREREVEAEGAEAVPGPARALEALLGVEIGARAQREGPAPHLGADVELGDPGAARDVAGEQHRAELDGGVHRDGGRNVARERGAVLQHLIGVAAGRVARDQALAHLPGELGAEV